MPHPIISQTPPGMVTPPLPWEDHSNVWQPFPWRNYSWTHGITPEIWIFQTYLDLYCRCKYLTLENWNLIVLTQLAVFLLSINLLKLQWLGDKHIQICKYCVSRKNGARYFPDVGFHTSVEDWCFPSFEKPGYNIYMHMYTNTW